MNFKSASINFTNIYEIIKYKNLNEPFSDKTLLFVFFAYDNMPYGYGSCDNGSFEIQGMMAYRTVESIGHYKLLKKIPHIL